MSLVPDPDGEHEAPAVAPALPVGRYGRPPSARRRRLARAGLWTLGAAGLGVTAWIGWGMAAEPVRHTDVGFSVDGSHAVEVTFDVSKDADATAVCTVVALSSNYAQVGSTQVEVGPAARRDQRIQTTVRTSEPAVTGLVESCRIAAD